MKMKQKGIKVHVSLGGKIIVYSWAEKNKNEVTRSGICVLHFAFDECEL